MMATVIPQPQTLEQISDERYVPAAGGTVRMCGAEAPLASALWEEYFDFGGQMTAEKAPVLDGEGFACEKYELSIGPEEGIRLRADNEFGLLLGIQTLRQLRSEDGSFPCVRITDAPRYRWRGMMLDVVRHFFTVDEVKKIIDSLALIKINRLHLHLSDDQGWRVELRKYPGLAEQAGRRPCSLIGHELDRPRKYDRKPVEGFYRQSELRELVDYAAGRGIVIIPEIDMPGHMQALLSVFPQYGSMFPAYAPKVRCHWGVSEYILNPFPETMEFLKDIYREIMEIFPGRFIHIGGDEAVKTQWSESPEIQQFMADHQISDEHALQGYMTNEMGRFLMENGRRLLGWSEIFSSNVDVSSAIMDWLGRGDGAAAARKGHMVVNASCAQVYLDKYQGPKESEPLTIGGELPLEKTYGYKVVPEDADLDQEARSRYIGGQAQLWCEYIPDVRHLQYMMYPRLAAVAERLWSEEQNCDYADFLRRLPSLADCWKSMDINFREFR